MITLLIIGCAAIVFSFGFITGCVVNAPVQAERPLFFCHKVGFHPIDKEKDL